MLGSSTLPANEPAGPRASAASISREPGADPSRARASTEAARARWAEVTQEKREELAAELGDSATVMQLDVSDAAAVTTMFATLKTRFGGVDLLFNNAGLGISSPFESSDPVD